MITLRLNTESLRAMIEENPEFKLEIQKSVINNIKDDNIENAVRDRITAVLKSMGNGGDYYNRKITITDTDLIAAIKTVVDEQVKLQSTTAIKNAVADLVITERTVLRKELKLLLKEEMIDVLTPEMAKEILLAKLV
jgi:hypothetical protein